MKGKLYQLKPGRQRPLWKDGKHRLGRDDVSLATISQNDIFMMLDDYPINLTLQWYRVLFKDMVGWLQAGDLGFNDLFEVPAHQESSQDA